MPARTRAAADIGALIGKIPHRLALAGGWIDQPFVSARNPSPPGSMVVVGLEPDRLFMDRAGMASGTRKVALRIWNGAAAPAAPFQMRRATLRVPLAIPARSMNRRSGSRPTTTIVPGGEGLRAETNG